MLFVNDDGKKRIESKTNFELNGRVQRPNEWEKVNKESEWERENQIHLLMIFMVSYLQSLMVCYCLSARV